MDHLVDPELIRHFEWDAQRISRFDGERNVQIYMELWTGEHFWDTQVKKITLFHFKITLTSYEDVATRGGENGVPQTLCGQESALVIWNREVVSSYGEDH